ncbi:gustatory receptor Gr103 [Tribolium castaneum]|uniref:Gustatory receptor n=1 Tax=Tribolium castaneum TaxID=7070 RepID=B8PUP8_TRICA|nr:gustatory receptor Gr103 [Tribolium castaneum]ABY40619.1 gustatory receptor [Tribolium castaneum]EFA07629.1 gustatory receptor 136 [Tribolium castaneum]|eukprot:XP_008195397.1 PREDICTED: gustatory receptor 68a-like isoform X2 [Tribolium castaneum]
MYLFETLPNYMIFVYRSLGIIQFCPKNSHKIVKISPTVLYVCLQLYFLYTSVKFSSDYMTLGFTGLFHYLDLLSTVGTVLSMLTSLVMFRKRSKRLKTLLEQTDKIEIFQTNEKSRLSCIQILLFAGIVGLILLVPFSNSMIDLSFFYFIPLFINIFDHMFLCDILNFISSKFGSINHHLRHQIKTEDEDIKTNIRRVQELSFSHYNLVDLTKKITRLFEITTLAAMGMWFGYMVDGSYYTLHVLVHGSPSFWTDVGFNCMFGVLHFFWLCFVIDGFARTQNTANLAAIYLHDIWNKYLERGKLDRNVRYLQLISIRFYNTKVRFTAMDFFSLDWTFGHLMIAAVATYVVILIEIEI